MILYNTRTPTPTTTPTSNDYHEYDDDEYNDNEYEDDDDNDDDDDENDQQLSDYLIGRQRVKCSLQTLPCLPAIMRKFSLLTVPTTRKIILMDCFTLRIKRFKLSLMHLWTIFLWIGKDQFRFTVM